MESNSGAILRARPLAVHQLVGWLMLFLFKHNTPVEKEIFLLILFLNAMTTRGIVNSSNGSNAATPKDIEMFYYTIEADGEKRKNAAWTYPGPEEAAGKIEDHISFWKA